MSEVAGIALVTERDDDNQECLTKQQLSALQDAPFLTEFEQRLIDAQIH